jgi:hypothetical protein
VRPNPNRTSRGWSRSVRLAAMLLVTIAVAITAGCGTYAQTLSPYTPSEGVNADVGGKNGVRVRNLLILSRAAGEGVLSGTLLSYDRDSLTSVTGKAYKADGSEGAAITASISQQISLGNGSLIVLTDRPPITLKSPDLKAGLTAQLTLQFSTAGQVTVNVPVVDASQGPYSTITPAASASPAA